MTYGQRIEEMKLIERKHEVDDKAKNIFNALASGGANNEKLARLLIAWDFCMSLLGWDVNLTNLVTHYQASIDAKFHDDYKAIATIQELDERMAKRRTFGKNDSQSLI